MYTNEKRKAGRGYSCKLFVEEADLYIDDASSLQRCNTFVHISLNVNGNICALFIYSE